MNGLRRAVASLAAVCVLAVPLQVHAGFGDGLRRTFTGLGGGLQTLGQSLSGGLGDTLGGLGGGLAETSSRLAGNYLIPTPGTRSFEDAVEHQGIGRRVLYIRPETDSDEPAPAIVLLHFRGGTAERIANLAEAGRLAAEHGAWVILPQAMGRRWNENPNGLRPYDDVGYLQGLIEQARSRYPIDADRIYMAGMSNGGFMASRFACEHPDMIAGVAQVAATMRRQQHLQCPQTESPVPMLLVLGTSDILVPYNGRLGLFSSRRTLDRWAENNGCDAADETTYPLPDTDNDGTSVAVTENLECAGGSGVRLLTVHNGGHAWPGGDDTLRLASPGRTSDAISATDRIWSFLSATSRR